MFQLIIFGIALILLVLLFVFSYVKAPPDMAYIISGAHKNPRILVGKSGFRIPFLERLDKLYLGAFQIDVKTTSAVPTAEFINVKIDSTVSVQISRDPVLMQCAARNFLNVKRADIAKRINDLLEGNLREITGTMRLTDMVSDRKTFSERVQENAVPDLERLGLELVSFNVQNFNDENGVINDLGIDNIEQIKKTAAIAKSDAQRDIAIQQAANQRAANEARVKAATQIAEQNTALEIKSAELKTQSEVKRATADMAYNIQQADQKKELDVAQTNAQIAQAEREVELRNQQIALKEKELDAIVRKQADADLYATERAAEADLAKRQREAEEKAYEEVQRAEAAKKATILEAEARKAMADAEKYAVEQEAAGIAAKYAAEAEGIKAKGLAEAEGIYRKADAQRRMGEASVLEMYYAMLPKAIAAAAEPLSNVDKIVLYGEGAQTKLISDVMNTSTQVIEAIKQATGIDPTQVIASYLGSKAGADN